MSTGLIGKCSWYFSHPTTRIEYNSRSSGGQMLQPVLFYKPPNDVRGTRGGPPDPPGSMETALACICTNKQFDFRACEFPITQRGGLEAKRTRPTMCVCVGPSNAR